MEPEDVALWRPLSLGGLLRAHGLRDRRANQLLAAWLLASLACIGSGLVLPVGVENHLHLRLGQVEFFLSLYPPLVFSIAILFWLGLEWAVVPAYLATVALALRDGMPVAPALLFGLADPFGLGVYAVAYWTTAIPYDLRSWRSAIWFVVVAFVSAVASSVGSFVPSQVRGMTALETFANWQAWWLGSFTVAVLWNAPLFFFFGRRVERWKQRHFQVPPRRGPAFRWIIAAICCGSVTLAGFLLASGQLVSQRLSAEPGAARILELAAWSGAILVAAVAFGGILLAYGWTRGLSDEVRLRTAEFRDTFEQAAVGIVHVDPRGMVLRVNRKLLDMLGYQEPEMLGRFMLDFTHPEDREHDLQLILEVLGGRFPTVTVEKRYLRKDQSAVWAEHTVSVAREGKIGPDSPLLTDVREVEKAARRGAGLTKQLLAFSRRQPQRRQPVDLNASVRELETMLRRLLKENVEVRLDLDPDLAKVLADPSQIEQLLMNLVVNAGDAMPSGGVVSIETRNDGQRVRLHVRDTGVGMDPETASRVFEPFFTTKPEGQGTGLGLSTVYGIVQQSGGAIAVDSAPGRGAAFQISFPRMSETQPQAGARTVLVVEDETEVRRIVVEVLRDSGYHILEARDAEDAIRIGQTLPGTIDLLLTDIVLPGMNGWELAGRLQGERPAMRILYASSSPERGDTRKAEWFLAKPFSPQQLVDKVREIIG
ncbi:MAG: PAS domain S-box protein [Acidobacteria bacterium]|nr:PAS domain S-box protein [Acidobacteriota bacterium]